MAVKAIPEGYHAVTPYLMVTDAGRLIDFLKQAFGAVETERVARPDGGVMHAEVRIGDSAVMMGEPPGGPAKPAALYLYVADVDATYARALAVGATAMSPPTDQFYGDRSAGIADPAGNTWWIATHVEDVPKDELARRAAEAMKKPARG